MAMHFAGTVSPAVVFFALSRLAVLAIVITAYSVTAPLDGEAQPARTARSAGNVLDSASGGTQEAPELSYARHAANIAVQSVLIAELHDEEQGLLCEALANTHCVGTNAERCSFVSMYCSDLARLREEITEERVAVEAMFELGFITLEGICGAITARGGWLSPEQAELRERYRTTLFAHLDALSALLRERDDALDPLRAAVQEVGGDTMIAELEVGHRKARALAAAEEILRSLRAIGALRDGRRPPRTGTAPGTVNGVRIPPCGGDVQCWEI